MYLVRSGLSLCVAEWSLYSGIAVLTNFLCLTKVLFREFHILNLILEFCYQSNSV